MVRSEGAAKSDSTEAPRTQCATDVPYRGPGHSTVCPAPLTRGAPYYGEA